MRERAKEIKAAERRAASFAAAALADLVMTPFSKSSINGPSARSVVC